MTLKLATEQINLFITTLSRLCTANLPCIYEVVERTQMMHDCVFECGQTQSINTIYYYYYPQIIFEGIFIYLYFDSGV